MAVVPGYKFHESIHRGARSNVTCATRLSSGDRVILKESAVDATSAGALARSQHEFGVAALIRSDHVVRYLGVERYDHRVALIAEAFGDTSLARLLARERLGLEAALYVGVQIASGLADIHGRDVIHRAIHPGNVVIDSASWAAKIVDFAAASLLNQSVEPTRHLDGHGIPLLYMSPEQTGRMNRTVDYRTDFYSLGATLYHALAGCPPFDMTDPLDLVHAHIALPHRSLADREPRVPVQVSRIVDKLLAKNAEDRYQSARGIGADLAECLRRIRTLGSIGEFPIGRNDSAEKFAISEKLYGREAERVALLDAFEAMAQGRKILLLVEGHSGVGKSSLVNEVHKPIVERRGIFASGKLDPLKRRTPYSVLAQTLMQLCRGLLGLPDEEFAEWRTRILEQLGVNAGLIVDLVPDLERVIGPQPPVPTTGLLESQHRFDRTLARFLSAFAANGRPLVLFLDDLQWADPATLHAIGALLRLPEPAHLLIIGAYRDNEVDAVHPLSLAIDELVGAGVEVRRVRLPGLAREDVQALVADTLHQGLHQVRELADLVAEKTSGNPFFVDQFLGTLEKEQILRFSASRRSWTWDMARVRALGITENVVDLLVRKVDDLPPATRDALRIGACAGDQFDLDLLSAALGASPAETRVRLAPAIRARLLAPLESDYLLGLADVSEDSEPEQINYHYKFPHDRIRQAAYGGIPGATRQELHLRLGRILLGKADPQSRREKIFDIVDQLDRGLAAVTDRDERLELAALNLEAGERARKTTAYQDALEYLGHGVALLPEDAWSARYSLWLGLHLGYAECAYLAGEVEEASAFSDALLPRIRTAVEKAELYSTRMTLESARGHHGRAIELGREALAALGHPLPRRPSLARAHASVARAMGDRSVEELAHLPELTDPRIAAVVKILEKLSPPAFWADQTLFSWIAHESLTIALQHGVTSASASGFIEYGLYLITREHDYEGALAFGRLALALVEREDAVAYRCHVHFVQGSCIQGYGGDHLRTCIPLLKRAIELGLESGDMPFTTYASGGLPEIMFMVGEPIAAVYRETELRERSLRGPRYAQRTAELRITRQVMRCLQGETRGRTSLTTDELDEAALAAAVQAIPGFVVRGVYLMFKTILCTLFGEHEEAVRIILAFDRDLETSQSAAVRLTDYAFFACLALVRGLRDPELDRRAMERILAKWRRLLARLADSAPANFRHKHLLVSAEIADVRGRHGRATGLYDEAIREATANGYAHHAALASELAGRAFASRGQPTIARVYLAAARAGYAQWGAAGKVRAMDEDHPELAPRAVAADRLPESLDAAGVVRASQALSSEIAPPELLERLMRVVVQASGARRGTLLIEREGRLWIDAHFDGQRNVLETPENGGNPREFVSEAIVRYALRTGKDVILAHAAERGEFTGDEYVAHRGSKSILCLPVRPRDHALGVLFLENDLSTDAFTAQRVEVLRLLVAQAAISLENARLYDATRKLNIELGAKEAQLRAFLEGMPVGVYVVDSRGQPAFMNRTAEELTGKDFDEALLLDDLPSVYRAYRAGTDEMYPVEQGPLARALRGERSMVDDLEVRRPDRTVPMAVWGTPIFGEDGAVRYAMIAFQDITQHRVAESQRRRLEEQLRLAERLESLGRLAGGVAHDFNNLLTPMLLYTELAQDALPTDSPIRANLAEVQRAAERAAGLTRQLLAFGRDQVLEPRVLDLNEEVRGFERTFRRLVRENIEVELRLATNIDRVRADPSQMQRVLMNLALNAADAMPQGGRVTLETENVLRPGDAPAPCGPCVVLRVRDTGTGMDDATLARVFDPFFTTKGPAKGTGLGLPTVYGVVAQHGGRLLVQSAPGKGTTFEVVLPRVGEAVTRTAGVDAPRTDAPSGHGETVLVVEDDDAVRAVLSQILLHDGYEVVTARSPTEALAVARGLGDGFELVVTDIVMPVMSGCDLVAELTRARPSLAVLFISGYSDEVVSASHLLDSKCDLLRKPVSSQALLAKVRDVLAKAAARRLEG